MTFTNYNIGKYYIILHHDFDTLRACKSLRACILSNWINGRCPGKSEIVAWSKKTKTLNRLIIDIESVANDKWLNLSMTKLMEIFEKSINCIIEPFWNR